MRVTPSGNNPGYGQGPQAERTNPDSPRKHGRGQQEQQRPQEEADSVELSKAQNTAAEQPLTAGKGPLPKPPIAGPAKKPLDLSA